MSPPLFRADDLGRSGTAISPLADFPVTRRPNRSRRSAVAGSVRQVQLAVLEHPGGMHFAFGAPDVAKLIPRLHEFAALDHFKQTAGFVQVVDSRSRRHSEDSHFGIDLSAILGRESLDANVPIPRVSGTPPSPPALRGTVRRRSR